MPATTVETVETVAGGGGGSGRHGGDLPGGGGGGGGRDDGRDDFEQRRQQAARTGIWVALAPILMLFTAFASAYIVRRGLGGGWEPLALPPVLWLNSAVLLLSSWTLEQARGALSRGQPARFSRWWSITMALGTLFLAGQLLAWLQLAGQGVYLASNPSGSFFYLLTATHAVHLMGGIAGLVYVSWQAVRAGGAPVRRTPVDVAAVYWHFLGILWVLLFVMLLLWR